jgi:hypothetical protein
MRKNKHRVFDNFRIRSIRELATLFATCDLHIGNDTDPPVYRPAH